MCKKRCIFIKDAKEIGGKLLFFFTEFDQMSRIGSRDGDLETFGNIFDSKRAL